MILKTNDKLCKEFLWCEQSNDGIDMNTASNDSWFYEKNGERIGPVSEETIIEKINDETLNKSSHVWTKGNENWIELSQTKFAQYIQLDMPPPLSKEKINNTILWVLAVAPILGSYLESLIAIAMYGNNSRAIDKLESGYFFLITISLNTLLAFLDENQLKKAGYNTNNFQGWWKFIVPVYIFQRSKHIDKNYVYLAVWIASLVATYFIDFTFINY